MGCVGSWSVALLWLLGTASALDNNLGKTPPLGWSSWCALPSTLLLAFFPTSSTFWATAGGLERPYSYALAGHTLILAGWLWLQELLREPHQ